MRAVADPVARQAEAACAAFLAEGDAGPLLEVVRDAARQARLAPAATQELEGAVYAALARAGTAREDDLEAAIAAFEARLLPRSDPR